MQDANVTYCHQANMTLLVTLQTPSNGVFFFFFLFFFFVLFFVVFFFN